MSTMLRTVNPEAAAESEGLNPRDRRVPYVGQSVLFHSRPGEGRMGKMIAPALITEVIDEDTVELLIIYAADDFLMRMRIPRKTEQNNINCWSYNAHDEEHYLKPIVLPAPLISRVEFDQLADEVSKLKAEVKELGRVVRSKK